ncbi:hypothetical protein [Pseudomonas sp. OHS18]|uniref:hypothetical protein n=1 Tax=Pseudomonas sp. OHS18 TaxID=3399679 RepID=UPI003A8AFF99
MLDRIETQGRNHAIRPDDILQIVLRDRISRNQVFDEYPVGFYMTTGEHEILAGQQQWQRLLGTRFQLDDAGRRGDRVEHAAERLSLLTIRREQWQ